MRYAADFETTTTSPASVWAWGCCEIAPGSKITRGESLEEFLKYCRKLKSPTVYFHNLKFDSSFLIYYLISAGYKWVDTREEAEDMCFTALISGASEIYNLDVYFRKGEGKSTKKVTFWDSAKILRMPLAEIAENFKLSVKKGHIDYSRHNTPCEVTPEEWEYLDTDVYILRDALIYALDLGLKHMTIGSCALHDFKETIGEKRFNYLFPPPDIETDAAIRKAFQGGYIYINPQYIHHDVFGGAVYDNNGLYSHVLANCPLPYGVPVPFEGEYVPDKDYPLYIQCLRCFFELKPGMLPTIQLRFDPNFKRNQYLESSINTFTKSHDYVNLFLPSPDLEIFFKHYNVTCITYTGGYKFKASDQNFRPWCDKWAGIKEAAEKEGNSAVRMIAKAMQNNLYGKFATNPIITNRRPIISKRRKRVEFEPIEYELCDSSGAPLVDDNGEVQTTPQKVIDPVYIPVGVFVTSWGRNITIKAAQKIHEDSIAKYGESMYIYSDTDSLHVKGFDVPDIPISSKTGDWKIETVFERGRYLGLKRYLLDCFVFDDNGRAITNSYGDTQTRYKIVCSGLPKSAYKNVDFKTFDFGQTYKGRYRPIMVEGGCILQPDDFTIQM